jgi:hypothetical protein
MTNQRARGPKIRVNADKTAAAQMAGYPYRKGHAAVPRSRSFLLIHFLSGSYRPHWRAVEATPGRFNLGLRGALAASVCLGRRCAVLCDVVSNDGARRAMEKALTGKCRGRQPKNDREYKKRA